MNTYKQLNDSQKLLVTEKCTKAMADLNKQTDGKSVSESISILINNYDELSTRYYSRIELAKDNQKILMDAYEKELKVQKNYYENIIQNKSVSGQTV